MLKNPLFRSLLNVQEKSGIFCLCASNVRWNTLFSAEIGGRLEAEVVEKSGESWTGIKKVAAWPYGGTTSAICAQHGMRVCFVAQFVPGNFGLDLSLLSYGPKALP